jgi:hypothetical protein
MSSFWKMSNYVKCNISGVRQIHGHVFCPSLGYRVSGFNTCYWSDGKHLSMPILVIIYLSSVTR